MKIQRLSVTLEPWRISGSTTLSTVTVRVAVDGQEHNFSGPVEIGDSFTSEFDFLIEQARQRIHANVRKQTKG